MTRVYSAQDPLNLKYQRLTTTDAGHNIDIFRRGGLVIVVNPTHSGPALPASTYIVETLETVINGRQLVFQIASSVQTGVEYTRYGDGNTWSNFTARGSGGGSGTGQPADDDLTIWASLTPSTDAQSLVTAADFAAMRVLLSLVPGTNVQAYSAILAATTASFTTADETKLDNITVTAATDLDAIRTKAGHISVTQAVDLDALESAVTALDQAIVLKGTWNASSGTFPGGGTAQAGWKYIVSVGGTVDGVVFVANDTVVAITDNASTTTYAANWHQFDHTDHVLSVAGKTGAVTLQVADITDMSANGRSLVTAANYGTMRELLYTAPFDAMAYNGLQVNGFQQISTQNGDAAGTTSGYYPTDEEHVLTNGSFAFSTQRVATPFSSRMDISRGIKIEATTGAALGVSDYCFLEHLIEGARLTGRLGWGLAFAKSLSIGRVLRSNVSGRGYLVIRNGSFNRSYVKAFDLVANTDTYISATITGDTSGTWAVDTSLGLTISWCFGSGSTFQTTADVWATGNYLAASDVTNFMATTGNTVWLGPMVVLPGLYLPTFAELMQCQRSLADEERTCARYFQQVKGGWLGQFIDANSCEVHGAFPIKMRSNPSASLISAANDLVRSGISFHQSSSIEGSALNTLGGFLTLATTWSPVRRIRAKDQVATTSTFTANINARM